ncbi:MAG: hypothetical protein IIB73_12750, partial [Proteobacteria bacterium]|nr:hypothetical protein [Pseudomonadota bacterium]
MRRRYTGFAILSIALLANAASARPKLYTLVDLVEQAPLIVTGRVSSKTEDVANVVVEEVVKGDGTLAEIQLRDIARRIPVTPGLRLVPGEKVMLFLNTRGEFFTSDHQSKLDLSGSNRLGELVQLYLSTGPNNPKGEADVTSELLELLEEGYFASYEKNIEELYSLMVTKKFMPNTPAIANFGNSLGMGSACFVLGIEDSMESIMDTLKHTAMIHKSGGGTGFNFSKIRHEGDFVSSTSGAASGP